MPGRYLVGLLLIALGAIYLLEYLQVLPWAFLVFWWPMILLIIGLNGLIRRPSRLGWPLLFIAAGALLQLRMLGLLPQNLWPIIVAMALIVLGLRVLFPSRPRPWASAASAGCREHVVDDDRDRINDSVSFSSQLSRNASPRFNGGNVSVSFGNYELDLRGATLASTGADMTLQVSFGAIKVRVPEGWSVRVTGNPVFGSCTNKTRQPMAEADVSQRLHIHCQARFGAVEIMH